MKNFFESIRNVWKIEELKNRIVLTLGLLLVYRFGAHVPLPGIDTTQLSGLTGQTESGIGSILDMFTGGAFSKASVFALGIMPYISASIVVQLMGIAIPYLQKLQKDGESGRKKINQITRWLTILVCLVQAPGYIFNLNQTLPKSAFADGFFDVSFLFVSVTILVTGTIFAMWLGEKITDKGIGNGISLLIMIGILARMPQAFVQEFASVVTNNGGGPMLIVLEIIGWLVVIIACVLLVMAVRKIPVQYARRTVAGEFETDATGANRQFIPLKLNASGVMPIIFAQAIMFIPAAVAGINKQSELAQSIHTTFQNIFGFWYCFVFGLLIVIFTYFYTAITVPTNKMADDLKRSGGFIPGIKPGEETANYLDRIMSLVTFPGSLYLVLIAILPAIVHNLGVQQPWAMFYGGTSLIIMVGVAIDTIQQINAYILNRHYDGLMKSGKNRKAVA
ncbi:MULTISPECIES: preprotein translocase subunit SecY [unclassified Flavobacterium]|uniref:preprotein translocase subunit SecY n=1 Tax=unclassified Flavobacterium TaxID=196869 RepID=UPI001F138167|nr:MULTISPECIES: preprotein translocase subunit SecY [unclassified Flavobacterium]UMY66995.1 preprotein translocase subunit SecY [Flavobacterium sp. HJ-32-4]